MPTTVFGVFCRRLTGLETGPNWSANRGANVFTSSLKSPFHERVVSSVTGADADTPSDRPEDVPVWDDEYLDRVALRLAHHYDLERDRAVDGEQFDLSGELHVRHERHAIHPALTFGHHEAHEYLFAKRLDRPTVADLERLEALGERLAEGENGDGDEAWIDAHEDHYSTDFTFAVVATELRDDVREYVDGYRNRTLLKYGYNGHYEINLLVVVPEREESVSSEEADVARAFRVWDPIVESEPSRLDRLLGWLSR